MCRHQGPGHLGFCAVGSCQQTQQTQKFQQRSLEIGCFAFSQQQGFVCRCSAAQHPHLNGVLRIERRLTRRPEATSHVILLSREGDASTCSHPLLLSESLSLSTLLPILLCMNHRFPLNPQAPKPQTLQPNPRKAL